MSAYQQSFTAAGEVQARWKAMAAIMGSGVGFVEMNPTRFNLLLCTARCNCSQQRRHQFSV